MTCMATSGSGSRTAGTGATRERQRTEALGLRVIAQLAFFGAVPGSGIRGTSARRTATGAAPGTAAAAAVSALPGRCRKAAYVLTLPLFTSLGVSKWATPLWSRGLALFHRVAGEQRRGRPGGGRGGGVPLEFLGTSWASRQQNLIIDRNINKLYEIVTALTS